MRVVLDSNILARATPGKASASREVLLLLSQQPYALITSAVLLTELARILQYPRVRALHGLDDLEIQTYLHAVQLSSAVVSPIFPPPVRTRDADDDLVIAAAVAGRAEVLCTWDRHFFDPLVQSACSAYGVRILNDVDLLDELRRLSSTGQVLLGGP
jgi:putative PIN family toxin of toxin-antitoxin system